MPTKSLLAAGLGTAVISVLVGCGTSSSQSEPPPAVIKPVPGSSVQKVELTQQAVHRLGVTTRQVQAAPGATSGKHRARVEIPYSAVVYDTDGSTWTYVNSATRTFVRKPIDIDAIRGGVALLDKGPAIGTAVVNVGAPELLGAEYGISGEE